MTMTPTPNNNVIIQQPLLPSKTKTDKVKGKDEEFNRKAGPAVRLSQLSPHLSFELRSNYSDAFCCSNTGKYKGKIFNSNSEVILTASFSEKTYCCSNRVRPYYTSIAKLKSKKRLVVHVKIDTPNHAPTKIEIILPPKKLIGTVQLVGVHTYEITLNEKQHIIAEGLGSWFTGLWDYTFKDSNDTLIAEMKAKSDCCQLQIFEEGVSAEVKACLIGFMLKADIFRVADERYLNYEIEFPKHRLNKMMRFAAHELGIEWLIPDPFNY